MKNRTAHRPTVADRSARRRPIRSRGPLGPLLALVAKAGLITLLGGGSSGVHAESVAPFRVLDTRTIQSSPLADGSTTCRQVAGRDRVPGGVEVVTVNITAVRNTGNGYVTAYGQGRSRPDTSSLNFSGRNAVRANNAIVKVGSGDSICLHNVGSTHLVIDVTGYFTSSDYVSVAPTRLGDTRGPPFETPTAGETQCFGVPFFVPDNADGVFLNVAAVRPQANGYLVVHGADRPRPRTSTMNFKAGENGAIGTMAQLGRNGQVCVYVNGTTDVIVDINGYFREGSSYDMLGTPFRAIDTRETARLGDGGSTCFKVAGRGGVPWGANDVFATVTLVNPVDRSFAVAYPYGSDPSGTSVLNAPARENRSNGAWLRIGTEGSACIKVSRSSHLLVDVWGVVQPTGTIDAPSFEPGTLALEYESSNTSYCNYQPGGGPLLRSGSMDPQDWIRSAQKIGTLPIGNAAKAHYYKLSSHRSFVEYETCLNNRRWIRRYHNDPVRACGRINFPDSFPVGLPNLWTYEAGWIADYFLRSDHRPCPNV